MINLETTAKTSIRTVLHFNPSLKKKVVKVNAFLGESEDLKTSKFFDPPSENDWPKTELDPANFDTGSKQ